MSETAKQSLRRIAALDQRQADLTESACSLDADIRAVATVMLEINDALLAAHESVLAQQ